MKVIFNYATRQFEPMEPTLRERFALGGGVIQGDKVGNRENFAKPIAKPSTKPRIPKEELIRILNELKDKKVIGKHGIEVGKKLGYMLSGGDTTPSKILTEQNLYDLEREIFIDLISQKPTQERNRHTLDTGKPLFN